MTSKPTRERGGVEVWPETVFRRVMEQDRRRAIRRLQVSAVIGLVAMAGSMALAHAEPDFTRACIWLGEMCFWCVETVLAIRALELIRRSSP